VEHGDAVISLWQFCGLVAAGATFAIALMIRSNPRLLHSYGLPDKMVFADGPWRWVAISLVCVLVSWGFGGKHVFSKIRHELRVKRDLALIKKETIAQNQKTQEDLQLTEKDIAIAPLQLTFQQREGGGTDIIVSMTLRNTSGTPLIATGVNIDWVRDLLPGSMPVLTSERIDIIESRDLRKIVESARNVVPLVASAEAQISLKFTHHGVRWTDWQGTLEATISEA
jgi:hypothetical protein